MLAAIVHAAPAGLALAPKCSRNADLLAVSSRPCRLTGRRPRSVWYQTDRSDMPMKSAIALAPHRRSRCSCECWVSDCIEDLVFGSRSSELWVIHLAVTATKAHFVAVKPGPRFGCLLRPSRDHSRA